MSTNKRCGPLGEVKPPLDRRMAKIVMDTHSLRETLRSGNGLTIKDFMPDGCWLVEAIDRDDYFETWLIVSGPSLRDIPQGQAVPRIRPDASGDRWEEVAA